MRILSLGSVPDNDWNREPEHEKERVQENKALWDAAANLGQEAVRRGHTIMVGSDRETTIDYHVVMKGLLPEAESDPNRNFSMVRQAAKNSGLLPGNLRVSSRLSSR